VGGAFGHEGDQTDGRNLRLGIKTILFPDTENVLNGPQTGKFSMYPKGGVTINQLKETGSSRGTIALGRLASGPAALALDAKCKVPYQILDLPIGLQATDRFVDALRKWPASRSRTP
jgi:nitrogenase molybdenum-iron protein beta chain